MLLRLEIGLFVYDYLTLKTANVHNNPPGLAKYFS